MADKDNEFLDEHGDAFTPDEEDEFNIPDNAFDEDEDITEYADEFGDNFADDITNDIAIQEDGRVDDAEDPDLDIEEPILRNDQAAEPDGDPENGTEDSLEEEGEGESAAKQGIGWKAWTGVIALGLVTAGGLGYYVMPDSEPNRASTTPTERLPSPPPQQAERPQQRPTVDVQAFPQGAPEQNRQAPVTQNATAGGGSDRSMSGPQRSETEPLAQPNQRQPQQAVTPYNQNDTQAQQPSPSSPMPVNQEVGANKILRSNAPIADVGGVRGVERDRPGYLSEIEAQLDQFSSIARIAQQNATLVTQNREDLIEFQEQTTAEIKTIQERLNALESRQVESGQDSSDSSETKKQVSDSTKNTGSEEASKEDEAFTYNIPDTEKEIQDLQTLLTQKGYQPGPIDGMMGPKTRMAVKRVQQEHGLPITGWLSAETMMVIDDGPKQYSGRPLPDKYREVATKVASNNSQQSSRENRKTTNGHQWYVRGMTTTKAVVYRMDGMSYAVSVGSEIPGLGQVLEINPGNNEIRTAHGVINRRR